MDKALDEYLKRDLFENKIPDPTPKLTSEPKGPTVYPVKQKKISLDEFQEAEKSINANPALSRLAKDFMLQRLRNQCE